MSALSSYLVVSIEKISYHGKHPKPLVFRGYPSLTILERLCWQFRSPPVLAMLDLAYSLLAPNLSPH